MALLLISKFYIAVRLNKYFSNLCFVSIPNTNEKYTDVVNNPFLGKFTTDYANLPERYIYKKITKIKYRSPENPR